MVGNLTIDEILLPDGRYEARQCGGNCLYAAVGAHIWSDSVGIVSLVGSDFPAEWLDTIREAGIDTRGIFELGRPHEMVAGFVYGGDGERTVLEEDTVGRSEFDRSPEEWATWLSHSPSVEHFLETQTDAVGVHLAPMPVTVQEALVATARRTARTVTLDSPWWDGRTGRYDPHSEMLASLDALLPSEAEVLEFFRGPIDPMEAARALGKLGPQTVAVKVGARGSIVFDGRSGAIAHVPAYPCHAIDPTGAGDAFCGGFLVGLVETGDPVEAARYGTVSASFIVEGFGSLYALRVTREQAEERRAILKVERR